MERKPKRKRRERKRFTKKRAAMGLAAALAAYAVYLLSTPKGRRRPVTELSNALGLDLAYVSWRGVHYAYYLRPGVGRPVVLLHSVHVVAAAHELRPLVQRLLRETNRPLYVLEWLGFGHSDRPDIPYTAALLEEQLEHFLERVVRVDGGADVIGLGLGATYAAAVARRRPELVRALVALEPAGLAADASAVAESWAQVLLTLPGVRRAYYDRLTTPEALYEFARDNLFSPEFGVPDEYIEYGTETARVEGASRPLDDFLSGRLWPEGGWELFLHLPQPLLLVHGTVADRRLEPYVEPPAALRARPQTEIVALPTGALPHWERPGEVTERIVKFLATLPEGVHAA